ncbi:acyltransferase family protein [Motilimonas cestriensis]|uniref:acyltransferase family protein n=1 Tax=Motilimonas cestriensis TaxID=2742685 RepID=UPI003DA56374
MDSIAKKERNFSVDTLRGLACILLILCHVIGVNAFNGLKIEEGFLRQITDFLAYIRMPLFTFLSGYIYAYRPFNGEFKEFISGKATRLLIPMFVAGTSYALMHSITSGVEYRWLYLHICPVNLYWFVESLFLIFMFISILESIRLLDNKISFSFLFIIFSTLYILDLKLKHNFFSINGAIYLLPYFMAGLACYRFKLKLPKLYLAVLLSVSTYALLGVLDIFEKEDTKSIIGLIIGLLACYSLLKSGWKNKFLSYIGHYSFSIYLYHIFFTVLSKKVLNALSIDNTLLLITSGVIIGISLPIIIEKLVSRNKYSHFLALGVWKNKVKNKEVNFDCKSKAI